MAASTLVIDRATNEFLMLYDEDKGYSDIGGSFPVNTGQQPLEHQVWEAVTKECMGALSISPSWGPIMSIVPVKRSKTLIFVCAQGG